MVYPLTRLTLFPWLRSLVTSVKGLDNLPNTAPFIVASNHISQVDPLVIVSTLFPKYQKKIHYIAYRGNSNGIVYRTIAEQWAGCILINRINPGSQCLEVALDLLAQREPIGIFPEGSRVPNSESLLKGKTGVARLALRSGYPVIPIGVITKGERHVLIKGIERSLPWYGFKKFVLQKQPIALNIGAPIKLTKIDKSEINYPLIRQTTDSIMCIIAGLCNKQYPY